MWLIRREFIADSKILGLRLCCSVCYRGRGSRKECANSFLGKARNLIGLSRE